MISSTHGTGNPHSPCESIDQRFPHIFSNLQMISLSIILRGRQLFMLINVGSVLSLVSTTKLTAG
jgi:hypothetical protein